MESFITQHRAAHVSLERCAQSVPHQIPNERTRVIHLMDAPLQAAIAHIKSQSNDPNGLGNNFEEAAAYLLQFCPVSKKRKAQSNDRTYNVSSVGLNANDSKKKSKPNKGETGVELRYYKPKEYRKLSTEQVEELRQCRKEKGFNKDRETSQNKKRPNLKDQLVAAIKEVSKERESKESEEGLIRDFLVSVAKESKTKSTASNKGQENPSKGSMSKLDFDEGTINAIVKRLK